MFGLSALETRLAIYGVLLAVIGGWMAYERFHLIDEGEARELAKLKDSSDKLLAKAQQDIKDQSAHHAAVVAANQVQTDAALKANTDLSASRDRIVRQFDAYRASHPALASASGGSGPAIPGECGSLSCGELASRALQDSNDLARSVGELRAVLPGCQRDRDSLTGLPR